MTKPTKRSTNPDDDALKGTAATSIVPIEHVQSRILHIRGQKVILDTDLARLYGVQTRVLGQAVKRNSQRFPPDFVFRLSKDEFELLKSQTVISNRRPSRGGRRSLPYAFTEHGVIMAASVLNSERAVQASVFVVRAFVQLKRLLAPHKEWMAKLDRLESKVRDHDKDIVAIVKAIRLLMPPPDEPQEPFGFRRAKKN